MPTKADNDVMELYKAILEEAIIRIHSIDAMIRKAPGLTPGLIWEYCYLQLRMLCELVSIGCLLCHEDIPETKSKLMQKAYDPNLIFSKL